MLSVLNQKLRCLLVFVFYFGKKEMIFEQEQRTHWNNLLLDVKHLKVGIHMSSWFDARPRINNFLDSDDHMTLLRFQSSNNDEFKILGTSVRLKSANAWSNPMFNFPCICYITM